MLDVGRPRSWWPPPAGFPRLLASPLSASERNPKNVGFALLLRRVSCSRVLHCSLPYLIASLSPQVRSVPPRPRFWLRAGLHLAACRRKSAPSILCSILVSSACPFFLRPRLFSLCLPCLVAPFLTIDGFLSSSLHLAACRRKSVPSLLSSVSGSDALPIPPLAAPLCPVFASPYRRSPPCDGVQLAHAAERAHRDLSVFP